MTDENWKHQSVLIVGCGSIGRRHARVLRSLGVADVRCFDVNAAQRSVLTAETPVSATFENYDEALASRPTAVFVCTPPGLHVAQSVQALRAGAHVFCEKPLADTSAETPRLAAAIVETGRIFSVGFCMRHQAALQLAKAELKRDRIGRLISIRCRVGEHLPTVRPDYRTLFTLKEAGAFDLAHEIDLACWFAEKPVAEVKGFCGAYSDLGFTAPDIAEVLVRFESRCLASIHLDFFGAPRQRSSELIGTRGTIIIEYADWNVATVSIFELEKNEWQRTTLPMARDDMFASEDREFLQACATGGPVTCGFADALKTLHIVEAAQATELRSKD